MSIKPVLLLLPALMATACALTEPTLSTGHRAQLLSMAPGISQCKTVDAVYKDLSTAPTQVIAGLSSEVKEVWIMGGCEGDARKRIEVRVMGKSNGTLSVSDY